MRRTTRRATRHGLPAAGLSAAGLSAGGLSRGLSAAARLPGTRHRRHRRTPDTAPPPTAAPKNGLGIAALIAGILSLPAAFTIVRRIPARRLAIVLGFIGYRRARTGEATNGGMAIAGIVLGVLGIILSAVLIAVGVWGFNQFGGRDLVDCMQQAGNDRAAQQQCEDEFKGNLEDRLSITVTPTPVTWARRDRRNGLRHSHFGAHT